MILGQVCTEREIRLREDLARLRSVMSEYFHVEKPFLDQLATLGWTVIDQGHGLIPLDPATCP